MEGAGEGGLAQLRKELQAHRNLLAFLEAAKRARPPALSKNESSRSVLAPDPAANDFTARRAGPDTMEARDGGSPCRGSPRPTCRRPSPSADDPAAQPQLPASWNCSGEHRPTGEDRLTPSNSTNFKAQGPASARASAAAPPVRRHQHSSVRSVPATRPEAPVPAAMAAAPKGAAAARPPWRGPFSRATPTAMPQCGPAAGGPHPQHPTHHRDPGVAALRTGTAKPLPRAAVVAKRAAGARDCAGDDLSACKLARVLGELAAAAAMAVMVPPGQRQSPGSGSRASAGGAADPWPPPPSTAQVTRRRASDPGGAGRARWGVVCGVDRAGVAEGAAAAAVEGAGKAAPAAAAAVTSVAAGAVPRPQPRDNVCETVVQNPPAPRLTARGGGGSRPDAAASWATERPRPWPSSASMALSAKHGGEAPAALSSAAAGVGLDSRRQDKCASCHERYIPVGDIGPARDRAARPAGYGEDVPPRREQRAPAHLDCRRKVRRDQPGSSCSVRYREAAAAAGVTDDTRMAGKGDGGGGCSGRDQGPIAASGLATGAAAAEAEAAGSTAPAFPALDRVMSRRERLSALLATRCRAGGAAPPAAPSERDGGTPHDALAPLTAAAILPDGATSLARPSQAGGGTNAATTEVVPGQQQGIASLPVAAAAAAAAVGAVGDGVGSAPIHGGVGGGRGPGGVGRGTLCDGACLSASAAAAASGGGGACCAAAASDVYATMRAWRARRAAAAAVICGAARRYLDARAAAEAACAEAASATLDRGTKARVLAAWRGVCLQRARLRQRYARLAALHREASQAAALTHAALALDDVDLADVDARLVTALACLCYAPAGANTRSATFKAGLDRTQVPDGNSRAIASCGAQGNGAVYGLLRSNGWGPSAASHRRYCNAAALEEGRYGLAAAHRRWWLLRAAWCGLALNAVAPRP